VTSPPVFDLSRLRKKKEGGSYVAESVFLIGNYSVGIGVIFLTRRIVRCSEYGDATGKFFVIAAVPAARHRSSEA
jgi:hypothetical protein